MIDKAFEWLFEEHPILFDSLVVLAVVAVGWIISGAVSDYLTYLLAN